MELLVLALFLAQAAQMTPQARAALAQSRIELEFDRHWQAYLLAEHGCPEVDDVVVKQLTKADCNLPPRILADEREKWLKLIPKIAPELFKHHE